MKTADLRAKNKEELQGMVIDLKKEQFNLRMQASTGQLENKSRFKEVRRTIARVKTLLSETPKEVKPKSEKKPAAPKAAKKTKG